MDTKAETVERLTGRLTLGSELRARARQDAGIAKKRIVLRQWQADRLGGTHADLLADPRFHAAAEFFLVELYGPKDTSQRDADIARAVPTMTKLLPVAALETVADAVELDALSEDLDAAMVAALGRRIGALDAAAYGAAYRSVGRRDDRERQLDLVEDLGHSLDRLTRKAFAGTALKMMRKPAVVAGYGELQEFLQTGYDAFRQMKGADEFLNLILGRERAILAALFAGDDAALAAPGL